MPIKIRHILEYGDMISPEGFEAAPVGTIPGPVQLPRGKKIILQAEDREYKRGLVVELKKDGGYDLYYWYDDPKKVYPAEVKIDGKSVKKDGKKVHIGFHPELNKDKD